MKFIDGSTGGPFDGPMLRTTLENENVLKRPQKKPSKAQLDELALHLNFIRATFQFAKNVGNDSKPAADRVKDAIQSLIGFFDKRRSACFPKNGAGPGAAIVENEEQLRLQFDCFLRAMRAHNFQLDMDAGLLMAHLDSWRPLAEPIASAFCAAMHQKFGRSNSGPVPRFVAAVIPFITDERPSVENVGKHLKTARPRYAAALEKRDKQKIDCPGTIAFAICPRWLNAVAALYLPRSDNKVSRKFEVFL
jgi:hypothetical protein